MAADERVQEIRRRLARMIPHPKCELAFETPWQLLVATILSAQSTDATVNRVTPQVFRRWPTPAKLANATQDEVEEVIKSTGFFRNKSKAIRGAARLVADEHKGEVPKDMEAICALPGVARKTANVVLGTAYGLATGMVVDTHVSRVAQRLELTEASKPPDIERDLCALFPKRSWVDSGHRLLLHGRYVCTARSPDCANCALNELCPAAERDAEGTWTARAKHEAEFIAAPR